MNSIIEHLNTLPEKNECIVEHKFLFWKWKAVEHDFHIYKIEKFMYCSSDFIVTWKCSRCETPYKRNFVTHDELILKGISPEILNNISEDKPYYQKS